MRVSRQTEILDVATAAQARSSLFPRATVKSDGPVTFRSQVARDIACLFDVDPEVETWTCDPPFLSVGPEFHVCDFLVCHVSGQRLLVDGFDRTETPDPVVLEAAAAEAGFRYKRPPRIEVYGGTRLRNAKDLLRYGNYQATLGDRVRLLAALEEHGSLTVAECLTAFSETRSVAGLASMILNGFVEVDLDDELIGPTTAVRRIAR
ncbi:hypothetical protein [Mycoplana ramosa]|uniref:Uncharacterized protein n=1 Tax=Mycoplana ramosa TaxID=40837 RepID=A0ABW3Z2B2_MYCRA